MNQAIIKHRLRDFSVTAVAHKEISSSGFLSVQSIATKKECDNNEAREICDGNDQDHPKPYRRVLPL